MASTEQRISEQVAMGWTREEAASHVHGIERAERSCVAPAGVPHGHRVGVVDQHSGRLAVAFSRDGQLSIGGCIGVGLIGDQVTRPWREVAGDRWTAGQVVAILADGTEVRANVQTLGVWDLAASGQVYPSVLAAALTLTPAVTS